MQPAPAPPSATTSPALENLARKSLVAFVIVGVFLRVFRYVLPIPINGDEAMLGINILSRSFSQLLKPLNYMQVAPLGFLWSVRASYQWWGIDERAVRFFPALAGIATIPLFAAWARMIERPLAAAIATGILACGFYSVYEAVELKPYGFDLMCALILLLPATAFLLRGKTRSLIWLIALTPIALFFSYPAVFVAGAIGLTLGLSLRKMSSRQIILTFVYGIVLLASFYFLTLGVARGQYQVSGKFMTEYWSEALPPHQLKPLLIWLLKVHTGNMFAYPFGGKNGGSTLSTLLFLIGLAAWIKSRRIRMIFFLLCPFVLTFLAAALRRYPYGQATRVCQQLAPAIILLIGVGAQNIIEKLIASDQTRQKVVVYTFSGLMLIGAAQIAEGVYAAFCGDYVGVRNVARTLVKNAPPDATIAVMGSHYMMLCNIQWYLWPENNRVVWDAQKNLSAQDLSNDVWALNGTTDIGPQTTPKAQATLAQILGRPPTWHQSWIYKVGDWTQWDVFGFPASKPTTTK